MTANSKFCHSLKDISGEPLQRDLSLGLLTNGNIGTAIQCADEANNEEDLRSFLHLLDHSSRPHTGKHPKSGQSSHHPYSFQDVGPSISVEIHLWRGTAHIMSCSNGSLNSRRDENRGSEESK